MVPGSYRVEPMNCSNACKCRGTRLITCSPPKNMPTTTQVQISIRRLNDYARDLIQFDMNSFEDALNVLLDFCETDEVFSSIRGQLLSVPSANL